MQYANKVKIGIGIGIALIITVVSMVGLPFMDAESGMQKIPQQSIQKMEGAEEKILRVIMHERSELEWKMSNSP